MYGTSAKFKTKKQKESEQMQEREVKKLDDKKAQFLEKIKKAEDQENEIIIKERLKKS